MLSYLYKENNVSASLPAALRGTRALLFLSTSLLMTGKNKIIIRFEAFESSASLNGFRSECAEGKHLECIQSSAKSTDFPNFLLGIFS